MGRSIRVRGALGVLLIAIAGCGGGKAVVRGTDVWNKRVLEKREVVVTTQDVEGTGLKLTQAVGWTNVDSETVWQAFLQVDDFDQFLDRVVLSEELPPVDGKRMFRIEVNAPPVALAAGYDKIWAVAVIEEFNEGGVRRADFQATEGNIKRLSGSWGVEPFNGGTLVTFSMFIDFGRIVVPDNTANYFVRDFIETWGHNLRDYVEDPVQRARLEWAAARRLGDPEANSAPSIDSLSDMLR